MERTVKQRIIEFIKYKGIGQTKFEKAVGLSNGYLNQLRHAPSYEKIQMIIGAFPDLNEVWLLTGEGEMLKSEAQQSASLPATEKSRIRYWVDVEATAGGLTMFEDNPMSRCIEMSIPEFGDCTDAVNLYGDSMFPLYKSGQIIILKEWVESFIDFGNVYLVITKSGNRMVKYLRKGSDAAHVLCVSENPAFDPFEILIDDILKLYIVKGSISKNTL